MGNECSRSFDENKQWLKCLVAVNVHIRDALLEVLHNPLLGGIPSDPQQLYDFFQEKDQQDKIKELAKRRVLSAEQIVLLLSQNQRTFSSKWDTTLICVVIINFSKLPPPSNGWFKPLDVGDISVSAFVLVARNELRNRLNHATASDFNNEKTFAAFWFRIEQSLKIFKYTRINDFHNLESQKVDPTIFASQIGRIMGAVSDKEHVEQIISDVYKWQQDYNEKSKL